MNLTLFEEKQILGCYIKLEPSDLVWLHLRKDRFTELRKSKLMPRAASPYKIIYKINDNA